METETQEHVLAECARLHTTEDTKVRSSDIFSEDLTTLKQTAKQIIGVGGRVGKKSHTHRYTRVLSSFLDNFVLISKLQKF